MKEFWVTLSDPIGIVGVILVLGAYLFLNLDKLSPKSLTYLMLNAFGSASIAFSLLFDWNLPAFLIEASWALISLLGIFLHRKTIFKIKN